MIKSYPVVYCLSILPLSAVRWKNFVHRDSYVPPSAEFAVVCFFGLSGFFNVILLLKTRPTAGLFGQLMLLPPARPPSATELRAGRNDVETMRSGLGRLPPGR